MTSSDDFDAENSAATLASIGPDMPASKNVKGGSDKGLLPAGLSDLLAPQAQQDADAVAAVLSCFSQFGYQRIKPPLLEFETSLLGDGPGAALAEQTFRLLDPISRRMMALRSDMTAQIARISGTRLASRPRPLRLAYGGDVMRVVPDVLNPERQLVQAGAEIIGRDDEGAVAEIILAGVLGLQKAGIKDVTLDLGLPHLAEVLLGKELAVMDAAMKQQLFEAIGNRDISALAGLPIAAAQKLADVMTASGASTDALRALCADLDDGAASKLDSLLTVADTLKNLLPDVAITLDPLDMQGFGYHTSISFSLFAKGLRGAIAKGGAYRTGYNEAAVGISVYMERVLRGLTPPDAPPFVYISATLGFDVALSYIQRGRHIVFGSEGADEEAEARALGCQFIVRDAASQPEPL
jgi:ATP phosphoribosyltransferase regulatory subunit